MTECKQLCPNCGLEHPVKDFLGKSECYKCTLRKKEAAIPKEKRCSRCNDLLPSHLWKYCDDCKELGYKNTKKSWTRSLSDPAFNWHMNYRTLGR